MEFTLRPATAEDARSIRKLIRQVGINPTGLAWQRFILAVDHAGLMLGCGQVKPHGDGTFELASIAVMPEWRGRGVARVIIEGLISSHPGPLYLMCRASLGPFYEKFDFHPVDEPNMPPYYHRIYRLAKVFSSLGGEKLLIMCRK